MLTNIHQSLVDILETRQSTSDKGITHIYGEENEIYISYRDLYHNALKILYTLQCKGLSPGDELILQIDDNITFLNVFWGCLLGGIIPVPVSIGNNDEHRRKIFKIWDVLNNPHLITDERVFSNLEKFAVNNSWQDTFERIKEKSIFIGQAGEETGKGSVFRSKKEDVAFIQFSSGSTGEPKGVVLTHENLLFNLEGVIYSSRMEQKDSFLGWMPLTHDMGMIGFHLLPLALDVNQCIMPTALFIRRPTLWLKKASEHKSTVISSPNFGYGYFLNYFNPETAKDWDLSNIRIIFNGAEPISVELCDKFLDHLKEYGLKREAMYTVYGLAEASVAVAFPEPGTVFEKINVDRRSLNIGQTVKEFDEGNYYDSIVFAVEGYPVKHCFVRICDENCNELNQMTVGFVHIRGKNVTRGYYNNKEATDRLITDDGWVNTGDLGFINTSGQLVITGRAKDVIFVRGQNLYPHDIERLILDDGLGELGKIAVCGAYDSESSSEEIIAFVLFKKKLEEFVQTAVQIKNTVNEKIGLQIKHVIPVRDIPKTTSGKVQRYKLSELFQKGAFKAITDKLGQLISENGKKADRSADKVGSCKTQVPVKNSESIQNWLVEKISTVKKILPKQVGLEESFSSFGLDSVNVVRIASELSDWLGRDVSPTQIYDYANIKNLSQYLGGEEIKKNKVSLQQDACIKEKEDIAIVGIGCRFPQASNAEEFWNLLVGGDDAVTGIPEDRRLNSNESLSSVEWPQWGGFIDHVDKFDPLFFGISPREAENMDPQQRILLEVCWEAFEHAGINPGDLKGTCTGVFIGISNSEYLGMQKKSPDLLNAYYGTGNAFSINANRISYLFDFQGPSIAIDTACSSSLAAVHQACRSILDGECELAAAGGVNLILTPDLNIAFNKAGMLSKDGRCKAFDEAADGYVRGEGCGVVILKPLHKALEDKDTIYAVIKGSAANHNGKSSGLTVPNGIAQQNVIRRALKNARIKPSEVGYIEAHGTGTSLGDPIEFQALKEVFLDGRKGNEKCYVGSVKTNIGHLEAAAGIAGLIKAALMLRHGKIPPHLHFKRLNPLIKLDNTPFNIPVSLTDWSSEGRKRIAGVSSFGFGGSNVHVVLEEYNSCTTSEKQSPGGQKIVVLSANDKDCLKEYAKRLRDRVHRLIDKECHTKGSSVPECSLADIAYTLQVGRAHMQERLAITVTSIEELYDELSRYCSGENNVCSLLTGSCAGNNLGADHFLAHEEGNEYLKLLIKNRNYRIISKLWVSGLDIDWALLHTNGDRRKVALPTYPFRKERFWPQADLTEMKPVHEESEVLFMEKAWKRSAETIDGSNEEIGTLLFIVNEGTRGLVQKITLQNKDVHILNAGDSPQALGFIKFDKNTVLVDLSDMGEEKANTACELEKLPLIQTLIKRYLHEKLTMLHFTLARQKPENNKINLKGTVMAGFIRMLGTEYGKVYAKSIDLLPEDLNYLNEIILREVKSWDGISEVCYRNGDRMIPYMQQTASRYSKLPVTISTDHSKYARDKVIVITGGTRGIGLEIAKHLVKKGVTKLVLTGRQEIPDRGQWEMLIASKDSDRDMVRKITQLTELEKMGAKIRLYCGSLVGKKELKEYFDEVRKDFGDIIGVIHCAGLVIHDNPAFINKKLSDVQAVLEPKVSALEVLHEVFENDHLKFFVVFSSISAVIPGLATGISDYSAANYFMDAFVESKLRDGFGYYKSINWPSWRDTGMGTKASGKYVDLGLKTISLAEGLQLFDWCIEASHSPCISILKVDEQKFEHGALLQVKKDVQPVTEEVKPDTAIKAEGTGLSGYLKELFSTELKIQPDKIKEDADFSSLGVDSIILAEMVKKIEEKLCIVLDPSVFWQYPNIKALASFLSGLCDEQKIFTEVQNNMDEVVFQGFASERETAATSCDFGSIPAKSPEKAKKIAVIGVACRFPGALDKNEFWNNLKDGKDSIIEVPPSRWDIGAYFQEGFCEGKSMSKWGGFINGIEEFDSQYFHVDKDAAKQTDPLVRLFLEASVAVIRDAGYEKDEISNKRVGVFAGSRISSYSQRIQQPTKDTVVAAGQNFIAAHVSHFMNLKGPSMVVDTACSSSLVSLHLACQSLLAGETEMCIAGGVDLLLNEKTYISLSQAKALSPDGKCHTFDKNANGFVPGEGCGAVLLKPLDRAVLDGDRIYAVIEAAAVNNDGNTMGITTPNFEAQIEVIDDAVNKAGINPETISYIEAHGTGTLIGDPIELKALTSVFQKYTQQKQYCGIGSVKTNIGHLLSAAGIAGFIKVVLSVFNKQLPPTLNCQIPNPRFDFLMSPFYILNELKQWEPFDQVRRAGISSFGFGGTNAHVIVSDVHLQEFPLYKCSRKELEPVTFKKERLWIDKPKAEGTLSPGHQDIAALKLRSKEEHSFEFDLYIGNNDYIVRDHRVYGVRIMPGVTFIDLVYRALELVGLDLEKIAVHNVLFKSPIYTSELFDREVRMRVDKNNENYSVLAKSRKITASGRIENCWEENFRCEIHLNNKLYKKHIDVDTLKLKAAETLDLDEAYLYVRNAGIEHFEFMKPSGKIYLDEEYLLAEIELSKLGEEYAKLACFHPAFMDSASIVSFMFQYKGIPYEKLQPFIPIFIEGFHANAKTQEKCYIYVQKQNTGVSSDDMMYSTVEIADARGEIIAAFNKLSAKKIRTKDLITKLEAIQPEENTSKNRSNSTEGKGLGSKPKAASNPLLQTLLEDLKQMVAETAGIPAEGINIKEDFYELGLNSTDLLQLAYDLERKMGKTLYPTLLFEHSTIEKLGEYFSNQQSDVSLVPVIDSDKQESRPESEVMYFSYLCEKKELTGGEEDGTPGKVMVFDCADKVSSHVAKTDNVVLIKPGMDFDKTGKNTYIINYKNEQHFLSLIEDQINNGSLPGTLCYLLPDCIESSGYGLEHQVDRYLEEIYPVFVLCKAIHIAKPKERLNIFAVHKAAGHGQTYYSALSGLFKSMHMENNKMRFKLIETDMDLWGDDWAKGNTAILDIIRREACFNSENHVEIKYLKDNRYVKVLNQIDFPLDESTIGIRENGVYVIAGGTGGLGLVLAKHLVGLKKVRLALVGRSEPGREKEQTICALSESGSEVVYLKADITDLDSVRRAIEEVIEKWGTINGVINCAGINIDNLIGSKSLKEIEAVILPKVKGTVYLDEVTGSLDLDFFILYSSLVSIIGNIGQSDYAYANSFMDNFVQAREALCKEGRRSGKSISFNWPLWENGGMQVDDQIRSLFSNVYGIKPLDDMLGMEIFDKGLNTSLNQVILVQANYKKFMNFICSGKVDHNASTGRRKDECNDLLKDFGDSLRCNVYKSDSCDIEVIEIGSGTPILMLPAFGMTASMWYYQIKEWQKDYRMIIVHLPGHGNSKPMKGISLEKLSHSINCILEQMDISGPIPMIAASFGGMLAQDFACRFPEKLSSIVLVCSFSQVTDGFKGLGLDEVLKVFNNSGKDDLVNVCGSDRNTYNEKELIYSGSQSMDPIAALAYLKGLQHMTTRDIVKDIKMPVLIISGACDKFKGNVFGSDETDFLLSNIQGAKSIIYEDAGHFPYITHYKQFNTTVKNYLTELGG
ncbi:MAG: SDR family NAD(P)-dependent oxidoreductase [Bacillota bacterium]